MTQSRADEPAESATTGLVVPYPAEYNLAGSDTGEPLLRQIAASTGGHTFELGQPIQSAGAVTGQENLEPESLDLWPWLLLAALGLWPLEIAWRRWARLRIQ